nr:hypothetical protein [uncultured Desulfovibrio sp.]
MMQKQLEIVLGRKPVPQASCNRSLIPGVVMRGLEVYFAQAFAYIGEKGLPILFAGKDFLIRQLIHEPNERLRRFRACNTGSEPLGLMQAGQQNDFIKINGERQPDQPEPEIIILRCGQIMKAAGPFQQIPADKCCAAVDHVPKHRVKRRALQKRSVRMKCIQGLALGSNRPVCRKQKQIIALARRQRFDLPHLGGQLMRQIHIIVREPGKELAAHVLNTVIER